MSDEQPSAESNKQAIDTLTLSLTRIEALLTQQNRPAVVAQLNDTLEEPEEPPVKKQKLVFDDVLSETWGTKPRDATLKLYGNQKRYSVMWSFRNLVCDLEEACADPTAIDPPVVHGLLLSLKTEMAEHMRHIRIADRSKGGWGTIDNYQNDVLARGRDDECRLVQAERSAVRSQNDNKSKRSFASTTSSVQPLFGANSSMPFRGGAGQRGAGSSGATRRPYTTGSYYNGPSVSRPCKRCQAPDHWFGPACPNYGTGGTNVGAKNA